VTSRNGVFDRTVVSALVVGGLIITLALIGDPASEIFQWTRGDIYDGELWRLVTAHLVHLDMRHALINVGVLILLTGLFGHVFTPTRHAIHAFVGMLIIDLGLTWLSNLEWYVGLSGVLHTLAAAAVVRLIVDHQDRIAWGVAIFGLLKIAFENTAGGLPFSGDQSRVVTDAHLFGVLAGMILGLIPIGTQRARRSTTRV
jgi:rhomboid family GlyGly-CTERM serine protease